MSNSFPSLLRQMNAMGATDLFLSKGKAPAYRVNSKIVNTDSGALSEENLELFAMGVMSEEQFQKFQRDLEINVSYKAAGIGRFRISVFHQRQNISMVVRAIPAEIPEPAELGLPTPMSNAIMQKRGLVLIVGPSGSGKSTTLASLLNRRNEKTASHIITIEDPIEYMMDHKQSIVNQREIGVDTKTFHAALESALRQSPDVLGIGEIRNRDTMDHALSFADTGHLCIATLHANSATQAIERIINLFGENKREQVLISLSMHVRAILAQQLVPDVSGQLVAAFELLQGTPRMCDLIEQGDFASMRQHMEKDASSGMMSMDQSLYNLFINNTISSETALEYASSFSNMRLRMRLSSAASSSLVQIEDSDF